MTFSYRNYTAASYCPWFYRFDRSDDIIATRRKYWRSIHHFLGTSQFPPAFSVLKRIARVVILRVRAPSASFVKARRFQRKRRQVVRTYLKTRLNP